MLLRQSKPWSTLFPYTTLFRSEEVIRRNEQAEKLLEELNALHGFNSEDALRKAQLRMEIVRLGFSTNRLDRSEEHTSELQSLRHLVCRLLLEKKKLLKLSLRYT